VLREHNQRGGETNVCTGWHAIEFMLWGRDTSDTGPGCRPASDFIDGTPNADRRREFLLEITTLLCEDLAKVSDAWKPGTDNHRARFVANQPRALRAMFIGPALLASYEMAGERLSVALETRDQEEEPSCFSDTTDADFKADLGGIEHVLRGTNGQPGLIALVRTRDAAQADALAAALDGAVVAVQAMPHPFDAAIRASDETAQRKSMVAVQRALERLGTQVSASARTLDIQLPTEPHG
jgi:putative iron-regulated protein